MMNTNSVKFLIVSDLDGTIFDASGCVPSNIKKITSIANNSVIFSIATARPPQDVIQLDIFLQHIDYYSICLDGAIIIKIRDGSFTPIYENNFSNDDAKSVIKKICLCDKLNEFFIFTGSANDFEILHVSDNEDNDLREIIRYSADRKIRTISRKSIRKTLGDIDIRSISLFSRDRLLIEQVGKIPIPENCQIIDYPETRSKTMHHWLDILPSTTNKADALGILCDILHFKGGIIGLGNGNNDYEMIMKSNISYVPADAIPLLKKHATYTINAISGKPFIEKLLPLLYKTLRKQ